MRARSAVLGRPVELGCGQAVGQERQQEAAVEHRQPGHGGIAEPHRQPMIGVLRVAQRRLGVAEL